MNIKLALVLICTPGFLLAIKDPFALCRKSFMKGEYDEANACYERMMVAARGVEKRSLTQEKLNQAESLLGVGNYSGFLLLEERKKLRQKGKLKKEWDGSNPRGRTFVVYGEQGIGDLFFFVRFCRMLKQLGAIVILKVHMNFLKDVMVGTPYIDQVINDKDPMPEFDYDVYVMSLPVYISNKGLRPVYNVHDVPVDIPYLFAKQERIDYWNKYLSHDSSFKIGICWRAGPLPGAQVRQYKRDFPIGLLISKLSKLKGVSFYSLQDRRYDRSGVLRGHWPIRRNEFEHKRNNNDLVDLDKLDILEENAPKVIGFDAKTFDQTHGSFVDTFALMAPEGPLDLVISCDTAVANAAGALGARAWTLLPRQCDWRWMNDIVKAPWFPKNMILFRQKIEGEWEYPIEQIYQALKKHLRQ